MFYLFFRLYFGFSSYLHASSLATEPRYQTCFSLLVLIWNANSILWVSYFVFIFHASLFMMTEMLTEIFVMSSHFLCRLPVWNKKYACHFKMTLFLYFVDSEMTFVFQFDISELHIYISDWIHLWSYFAINDCITLSYRPSPSSMCLRPLPHKRDGTWCIVW